MLSALYHYINLVDTFYINQVSHLKIAISVPLEQQMDSQSNISDADVREDKSAQCVIGENKFAVWMKPSHATASDDESKDKLLTFKQEESIDLHLFNYTENPMQMTISFGNKQESVYTRQPSHFRWHRFNLGAGTCVLGAYEHLSTQLSFKKPGKYTLTLRQTTCGAGSYQTKTSQFLISMLLLNHSHNTMPIVSVW